MQTVTIISKQARTRAKEPFVLTLEQWENMDPTLKSRFAVVSTAAPAVDEAARREKIERFTTKVTAAPKTETDYTALLKEYKAVVKDDPAKAKELLLKMQVIAPNNSYVKKQLEKLK